MVHFTDQGSHAQHQSTRRYHRGASVEVKFRITFDEPHLQAVTALPLSHVSIKGNDWPEKEIMRILGAYDPLRRNHINASMV